MKDKTQRLNNKPAAHHLAPAIKAAPVLLTLALGACAVFSGGPDAQVQARATERWQALRAGQFEQAYAYNTAAFKTMISADAYRSRFGSAVKWLDSAVTAVNCPAPDKCQVKLRIDFEPVQTPGGRVSHHTEETWLLEEGQWYVFQPVQGQN